MWSELYINGQVLISRFKLAQRNSWLNGHPHMHSHGSKMAITTLSTDLLFCHSFSLLLLLSSVSIPSAMMFSESLWAKFTTVDVWHKWCAVVEEVCCGVCKWLWAICVCDVFLVCFYFLHFNKHTNKRQGKHCQLSSANYSNQGPVPYIKEILWTYEERGWRLLEEPKSYVPIMEDLTVNIVCPL